jgi:hypothetical protein
MTVAESNTEVATATNDKNARQRCRTPLGVIPAKAGIQYSAALRENFEHSDYWIARIRGQ